MGLMMEDVCILLFEKYFPRYKIYIGVSEYVTGAQQNASSYSLDISSRSFRKS